VQCSRLRCESQRVKTHAVIFLSSTGLAVKLASRQTAICTVMYTRQPNLAIIVAVPGRVLSQCAVGLDCTCLLLSHFHTCVVKIEYLTYAAVSVSGS